MILPAILLAALTCTTNPSLPKVESGHTCGPATGPCERESNCEKLGDRCICVDVHGGPGDTRLPKKL